MVLDSTYNYLGTGLGYPYEIDGKGRVILKSGVDLVADSIKHILSYEFPRFMRREFQSRIWMVLDEPTIPGSLELIRGYIIDTIEQFETRITLKSVEVEFRGLKVIALVIYAIKGEEIENEILLNLSE